MLGTEAPGSNVPDNGIQVCVRVRPLNPRERDEGHRVCVAFDDETRQVVLSAVDKSTLLQLRGATAKGYAFDRRYEQDVTSDQIYDDCISQLVDSVFRGYNATVLAYGQTGSGKTHTMSGGVGIHGVKEEGVTPRVIRHIFALVDSLNKKAKPGEKIEVSACALELYNEDLRDLALGGGKDAETAASSRGWDGKGTTTGLKLQERPVGKEGRVVPEVVGVTERVVASAEELASFYDTCMENRSTSSTKLNDRSSRSHAIFTVSIHRTMVDVSKTELGSDLKAKVITTSFTSKFHLVDLAGSERVKRSGVTGKELKEATHINSGLLALGNVIVALAASGEAAAKEEERPKTAGSSVEKKPQRHVPYRDSKLTRLLQDSLGGNSLTVLISCISPSEMDFEETNNTLKYANRACSIKNTPLPNRFTTLEEDLLPMLPTGSLAGLTGHQLQTLLLEDHEAKKERRERLEREKKEREAKRQAALLAAKEEQAKRPGFQRLRAHQYDELRRQAALAGINIPTDQMITDETLPGFGGPRIRTSQQAQELTAALRASRASPAGSLSTSTAPGRLAGGVYGGSGLGGSSGFGRYGPSSSRSAADGSADNTPRRKPMSASKAAGKNTFSAWLAAQESGVIGSDAGDSTAGGHAEGEDFFVEDEEAGGAQAGGAFAEDSELIQEDGEEGLYEEEADGQAGGNGGEDSLFADEDDAGLPSSSTAAAAAADGSADAAAAAAVSKSKFRRGPRAAAAATDEAPTASHRYSDSQAAAATTGGGAGAGAGGDDDVYDQEDLIAGDGNGYGDDDDVLLDDVDEDDDDGEGYDLLEETEVPKLLARFKVNQHDTLAVFKAATKEDFKDVIGLLPENTPLPASDKMTYLLARLEVGQAGQRDLAAALLQVATGESTMNDAVGPAVGCLMATFGTNMIASCIFDFEDPEDLRLYTVDERIELWGLQIPHNSVRPSLASTANNNGMDGEAGNTQGPNSQSSSGQQAASPAPSSQQGQQGESVITWSSVDRLNMSIGLLYALCNHAIESGIRCGFCVPRPQLLKRWMQAGVKMEQIKTALKLIYPQTAHDYEYYKASTVAWFMVAEVKAKLEQVLGIVH